jgi:DNA-binding NtrC family response regulator
MNFRILLVDDDQENLKVNRRLLSSAGYTIQTAETGFEAIDVIKKARVDFALILMDYHMPGINGVKAVEEILKIVPNQQIIAFSIDDTREVMRQNFKAGCIDFLDKNSDNEVLLKTVAAACSKYKQCLQTIGPGSIDSNEKSKFIESTCMTGISDATYLLCKEIHKIAPTDATILILGETGTGKEVIANSIHKLSLRKKGPLVSFNVAAEQPSLIDSSLFGHKRGSFTGANEDRLGKFKLADGGTIFLDEIGDLSLEMQVKLLRVIQEREIFPVGAIKAVPINVRIVAATHRNLSQMIKDGQFREDLYYRLNTVTLNTTPLRERPDDIEPLIALFTHEICEKYKIKKRFNRKCLDVFRKHRWQGNVRDLRAMVERHFITCERAEIQPDDLEASLFIEHVSDLPITMEEIDEHTENIKRDHLIRVLQLSKSKADAARNLRVAPNRLHYFLQKFGIKDLV